MRQPNLIGSDLRAWLDEQGLTELELSKRIAQRNKGRSVSQSWISRILAGNFKRPTRAVLLLGKYASIPIFEEASQRDAAGAKLIDDAVSSVWNGTRRHAHVIAKLIRVAKEVTPET
ncbi:hypothetical protein [Bradyrhizobium sp. USDA 3650]